MKPRKIIIVYVLIIVVLLFMGSAYYYLVLNNYNNNDGKPPYRDYCGTKNDCVPATCCHPDSVVNKYYTSNCDGVFCTEVCSGPLDCGAGIIECLDNHCIIVPTNRILDNPQEECERVGGIWGADPCPNSCNYKRAILNGEFVGCNAIARPPGCDCGSERCWNGESCEAN